MFWTTGRVANAAEEFVRENCQALDNSVDTTLLAKNPYKFYSYAAARQLGRLFPSGDESIKSAEEICRVLRAVKRDAITSIQDRIADFIMNAFNKTVAGSTGAILAHKANKYTGATGYLMKVISAVIGATTAMLRTMDGSIQILANFLRRAENQCVLCDRDGDRDGQEYFDAPEGDDESDEKFDQDAY